ncbi:hypothetical protein PRK78_000299 [Emydomyces testavorans]|uniref:Major facilitator superfamily (MFS) profile domain-containing protein n=1 Tax=Emydomyces testavorans TaxID=2070801 RepID=A0AAF0DAV2_9EURO|nr:hypothetical protein PRK78_000299 [Emydomyces testavorans]
MSIFPYVYHMVSSFHVTEDNRKIALYAGAVTSAFTFAEFCAGVFWGRMSDGLGRKPVLIMGLIGTAISMLLFGFASTLPIALLARALGGLLNGNIGVLQTTVAELVTEKEHQPRAYSIMPFVWCLGSIIGPALGGALAQPCDNYASLFPRNTVFDRYPFLLPNLVCVVILAFGITTGILFLEETHVEKKFRRDRGLEAGKWLIKKFKERRAHVDETNELSGDHVPCLFEESPLGYERGLALSTKVIGFMMAVQGVYAMIAQLWLFPFVVRFFGTLKTYRLVMCIWPPLYFAVPYLVLLPAAAQIPIAYIALVSKITLHVIAFPSNSMLLANAAPSKTVLGSINGVGASVASLSRSLGPTFTGFLHSRGLELEYSILSWWVCGIICAIGAIESFWIEDDEPNNAELSEKAPIMEDCEPGVQIINPVEPHLLPGSHANDLLLIAPSQLDHYDFNRPTTDLDDIAEFDLNYVH